MAKKNRRREKEVLMRLTNDEYDMLKEKSEEAGYNMSDYVRLAILYSVVEIPYSPMQDEKIARLLKELHQIGNEINNIAHSVNSKGMVDGKDYDRMRNGYGKLLALYNSEFENKKK